MPCHEKCAGWPFALQLADVKAETVELAVDADDLQVNIVGEVSTSPDMLQNPNRTAFVSQASMGTGPWRFHWQQRTESRHRPPVNNM
eukprot:6021888-Heterocapsa_arctica.AAC.1